MKPTILIALVLIGCGALPAPATDATPDVPDEPPPATVCTADMDFCGKPSDGDGTAVLLCNSQGTGGTETERCTYGCAAATCFACEPSKSVCDGEDLAMCGADGKVAGTTSCMNHGCQMDRCNECTPSEPFCDGASSVACGALGVRGAATACGAKGCNPDTGLCNACEGTGTSCVGDQLISCNNGDVMSATTCALGCSTTTSPHCRVMQPSYAVGIPTGVDAFDLHITAANARLDITSCTAAPNRVTISNGTATTIMGPPQLATVSQTPNPTICVVKFHSIVIDATAVLTILNGVPGQLLALESETSITINGRINFRNAGPGRANAPDVTIAAGTATKHPAPGAGGGGNALAGGKGGACVAPVCGAATLAGGAGGIAGAFSTTALLGGGKGGNVLVTGVAAPNGVGGAGGGALHLVALKSVVVGITGKIDLGGVGGTGTSGAPAAADLPAGGGGAGGTLLVEAPAVTISKDGVLAANGGGGAGGCYLCNAANTSCTHAAGQIGPPAAGRAVGGQCPSAGNGGSASNGVTPPSPAGQDSSVATAAGGGGGGGDGFIVLRARDVPRLRTTGAVISPVPQTGVVTAN